MNKTKKNPIVQLILLMAVILIFNLASARTGWEVTGIKGKVKEVKTAMFICNDKGETNTGSFFTTSYDRYGNLIKTISSDEIIIHKFNNYGAELEMISMDTNSNQLNKITHKFDRKGRKSSSLFYEYKNSYTGKTAYWYNSKSQLVESVNYDAKGSIQERSVYIYNKKNQRTEVRTTFSNPDNFLTKSVFKFNENGLESVRMNYSGKDNYPESSYIWKYDNFNNIIEENKYSSEERQTNKWIYKYSYDKKGNILQSSEFQIKDNLEKMFIYTEYSYIYW